MRPTEPSGPSSMPSYRRCATRMVRDGWKPSLRDASCWRREVMKGGVGWRRRSFRSTFVTVQSAPASPASISSTRAFASRRKLLWSSLCPPTSVGRQVDVLLVLGGLLDVLEHLRLALDDVVLGREVALDVDPELRLGQVHHVPDGRLHLVVPPEVHAERLGLGRRLDDDEVLGHVLHAARRRKRLPG